MGVCGIELIIEFAFGLSFHSFTYWTAESMKISLLLSGKLSLLLSYTVVGVAELSYCYRILFPLTSILYDQSVGRSDNVSSLLFDFPREFSPENHEEPLSYAVDSDIEVEANARYIAWIRSPADETHLDVLLYWLTKLSGSWTLKKFASNTYNKEISDSWKKPKKPQFPVSKEDYDLSRDYNYKTIVLWLKEFQNGLMNNQNKSVSKSAFCEPNLSYNLRFQSSVLVRRIPLGIFSGCPYNLDDSGREILLYYSAIGTIPQSRETHTGWLKHLKLGSEGNCDSIMLAEEYSKEEATAGASLVFRLTDVAVSMAASLFDTEESSLEFIRQMKVK